MAHSYSISNQEGLYFITCTVHQWVDVFTRAESCFPSDNRPDRFWPEAHAKTEILFRSAKTFQNPVWPGYAEVHSSPVLRAPKRQAHIFNVIFHSDSV